MKTFFEVMASVNQVMEVDAGEILVQAAVPVLKTDDHASLAARIQRQEHNILPLAVALAAQKLGL